MKKLAVIAASVAVATCVFVVVYKLRRSPPAEVEVPRDGNRTAGILAPEPQPPPTQRVGPDPTPPADAATAADPADAGAAVAGDAMPTIDPLPPVVPPVVSPDAPPADPSVPDPWGNVDAGAGGGGGPIDPFGPSGRVTITDKQALDESTLTPDVVLAKIQAAYITGIKRCYKSQLQRDPTMRGKLKLDFMVDELGRTKLASAKGFDSALDTCVTGLMASWRFPIPKDRDGEVTEASFTIALQLVPD